MVYSASAADKASFSSCSLLIVQLHLIRVAQQSGAGLAHGGGYLLAQALQFVGGSAHIVVRQPCRAGPASPCRERSAATRPSPAPGSGPRACAAACPSRAPSAWGRPGCARWWSSFEPAKGGGRRRVSRCWIASASATAWSTVNWRTQRRTDGTGPRRKALEFGSSLQRTMQMTAPAQRRKTIGMLHLLFNSALNAGGMGPRRALEHEAHTGKPRRRRKL